MPRAIYIPPGDGVGFSNPATANLDMAGFNISDGGTISADKFSSVNAGDTWLAESLETDSATAEGFVFNTVNALTSIGAKFVSFQEQGVEHFAFQEHSTGTREFFMGVQSIQAVGNAPMRFINASSSFDFRGDSEGVPGNISSSQAARAPAHLRISARSSGTTADSLNAAVNIIATSFTPGIEQHGLSVIYTDTDQPTLASNVLRLNRGDAPNSSGEHRFILAETGVARVERFRMVDNGDSIWSAVDATNDAVVSSPILTLRANYDADATAGVTPTKFDATLQHVMLTAGVAPTSKYSVSIEGAERLILSNAAPAAYTRNATVVEDRTLLASASATTLNNNNVLAALIADLQARGLIG